MGQLWKVPKSERSDFRCLLYVLSFLQDFGSPVKKCDFAANKVEDTLSPASQDEEEDEDEIAEESRKTQAQSSAAAKNVTETLGGELVIMSLL